MIPDTFYNESNEYTLQDGSAPRETADQGTHQPSCSSTTTHPCTYTASHTQTRQQGTVNASHPQMGTQPVSEEKADTGQVFLDPKNISSSTLPDKTEFLTICDSGAVDSLITETTIRKSSYLQGLKRNKAPAKHFVIAGGATIQSCETLSFNFILQGHSLFVTAYIIMDCGAIGLILGNSTLRELQGTLDFRSNTLNIKGRRFTVKSSNHIVIHPNESLTLHLNASLPTALRNSDLMVCLNSYVKDLTFEQFIITFSQGKCEVPIHNYTNKIITIPRNKIVGYVDIYLSFAPIRHMTATYGKDVALHVSEKQNPDRQQLKEEKLKLYPFLEADDPKLTMTDKEIIMKEVDLTTNSVLTDEERSKFRSYLYDVKDVFSLHGEVGDTNYTVSLQVTDTTPFFIRPYSVSEKDKVIIDKHMKKLVLMNIIKPGLSSYSSPVLLVEKKGQESKRCCADFRYLNTRLVKINFPFPLVKDTLQKLGASKCNVISSFDIKEAFHSIRLDPESQKYCGICSFAGGKSYFYLRLGMGLSCSGQLFQEFVDNILNDIPDANSFLAWHCDDLLLFGKKEDHAAQIDMVMQTLIKNGLKLSPKKCHFFKSELVYMGHLIQIKDDQPHITPLQSRCSAIDRIATPKTPKQVRAFIGAVNYLSMFCPKLAELLKPLYGLTKKGVKFEWLEEHQINFEQIKSLLKSPAVLAMPTADGLFKLYSDCSRVALGGTLCQIQNGQEKVIAYNSKALPDAAKRYSVSELEAYGVLQNVLAFKNLLCNNHFKIIVDHSALVNILRSKSIPPTMRLLKVIERLSPYSFDICYMKGSELLVTDWLSRHIENDKVDCIECKKAHKHHGIDTIATATNTPVQNVIDTPQMLTRSQTKQLNIDVPGIFHKQYRHKPCKKHNPKNSAPTENSTSQSDPDSVPPIAQPAASNSTIMNDIRNFEKPPVLEQVICDNPATSNTGNFEKQPVLKQVTYNTDITLPQPSLVNKSLSQMGQDRLAVLDNSIAQKRLLDNEVSNEYIDKYSDVPAYLYKEDTPLFPTGTKLSITHQKYPKQQEITKMLRAINKRHLQNYNLPIAYTQLKMEQQKCPTFQNIYQYLSSGIVPSDNRAAKSLMKRSNQFTLVNGLLFKFDMHPDGNDFKLALCIPDNLIHIIIHKYHSNIFASHQGVHRTYLRIRQYFFAYNLYDKIYAFIRSCINCQQRKNQAHGANERPYQPRIFYEYRPFSEVHADIKHLFRSHDNYSYLLVCQCVLTRYIICIPLRSLGTIPTAEALLQRVVLTFGPIKRLVMDEGTNFTSKVMLYICNALNIEAKYIAPYSHNSNCSERAIYTVSRLLLSHLQNTGRDWTGYISAITFSYNTFAMPSLGNLSPYELVFARKPPEMLGLDFAPLTDIPVTYHEYLTKLQDKFKKMGKIVLDLQYQKQIKQSREQDSKLKSSNKFSEGQLVFLLCPSSSDLHINSKKMVAQWTGPLIIHSMLDEAHVILKDLQNKILFGCHSIRRIKPAFVRTSTGVATHFSELQKQNPINCHKVITDEKGKQPSTLADHHCLFLSDSHSDDTPQSFEDNLTIKLQDNNLHLATTNANQQVKMKHLRRHFKAIPQDGDPLFIGKIRYKNGHLQILLKTSTYAEWFSIYQHPYLYKAISNLLIKNPNRIFQCRICGSHETILKKLSRESP